MFSKRDAFIRGIRSDETRQRLFENDVTEWDKMVTMARAIESSFSNSSDMKGERNVLAAVTSENLELWQGSEQEDTMVCAAMGRGRNSRGPSYGRGQGSDRKCYFCGYENHPRSNCSAQNVTCLHNPRENHGHSLVHNIIEKEHLEGVFSYLDNIAVAGHDQEDHDKKVDKFISACKKYNLTLNPDKTISSVTEIAIQLGFLISKGKVRPDPGRMRPLLDLPVPTDERSLKRVLGLFSYYSQWVPKFSDKIKPLTGDPQFPLSEEALTAFAAMKSCIAESWVTTPNDSDLLVVETDASGYALSASLNQSGKPVAFFSRSLKDPERRHSSIEKEECAIVEACRKWRHYLALVGNSY